MISRGTEYCQVDWIDCYDDVLDRRIIDVAYHVFKNVSIPSGNIVLEGLTHENGEFDCSIIEFFERIKNVIKSKVDCDCQNLFFEFWTNRGLLVNDIVDYHVDNDERLRKTKGLVKTPMYGAILYLGPDELEGGGTYFNPPIEIMENDEHIFKSPLLIDIINSDGVAVDFKVGRLIIFDGNSPHCVASFSTSKEHPRTAILCNVWDNRLTVSM